MRWTFGGNCHASGGKEYHAGRYEPLRRMLRFSMAAWLVPCLSGCSDIPLLDPKGPIGKAEMHIIGVAFALMLIVVIPVIIMAIWFPRRYSASNPKGGYDPKWSRSARIDLVVWLVPAIIVLALGILTWQGSHRLDPFRPIDPGLKPLHIEVVSLDWKWLFIYPQQDIATVNRLVIPAHVPISFRLTSDTVMTAFFIPQLGSQIYALAGRQSRLHLLADTPGVYTGQNQQFSGRGFADMHFKVRVTSRKQFAAWVHRARQAPHRLDAVRFKLLSKPGVRAAGALFSPVSPGLFDTVVNSFHPAARKPGAAAGS